MLKQLAKILPLKFVYSYESFILNDSKRAKRFLTSADPNLLTEVSERKALYIFKLAAENVPAYKKFLEKHKINPDEIKTVEDLKKVPTTTKENYIKKYPYEERCLHGKFPEHGSIDESSGTSGVPTNWIRSKEEVERLCKAAQFEYDYTYNPENKRYIIISAWSMGAWATGVKFAEITENFSVVKSTGPEVDKIINTMKAFGRKYDYLIGGYPPFIKKLVDEGSRRIKWKDYKVDFVTGGEGFVEEWRDYIKEKIGNPKTTIISSFGASDIDIGIAFETPFSIFVRRLAKKNKKLRMMLFGANIDPNIFQYDVTEHHIENIKEKGKPTFHITLLNPAVASPKVKYALMDEGNVIHFDQMFGILGGTVPDYMDDFEKQGYNKEDILKLPFLFVTKRIGDTISIDGANIYPAQISLCVHKDRELQDITNNFKIAAKTDSHQDVEFYAMFELKKGIHPTKSLKEHFHNTLVKYLTRINEDFKESYFTDKKAADPRVFLYDYHDGPFGMESAIKHKYILKPAEIAIVFIASIILSGIRYANFGADKITGTAIFGFEDYLVSGASFVQGLSIIIMVFSVLVSLYGLIKYVVLTKRKSKK